MDQTHIPELDPAFHGLTDADAAVVFGTNITSMEQASLSKVMGFLKQTYCGSIGLEYVHITHSEQRRWVQDWFEDRRSTPAFSKDKKIRILKQVTAAETLEQYLHKKYVGQKRFSLEGGDSLIPAVDWPDSCCGSRRGERVGDWDGAPWPLPQYAGQYSGQATA